MAGGGPLRRTRGEGPVLLPVLPMVEEEVRQVPGAHQEPHARGASLVPVRDRGLQKVSGETTHSLARLVYLDCDVLRLFLVASGYCMRTFNLVFFSFLR